MVQVLNLEGALSKWIVSEVLFLEYFCHLCQDSLHPLLGGLSKFILVPSRIIRIHNHHQLFLDRIKMSSDHSKNAVKLNNYYGGVKKQVKNIRNKKTDTVKMLNFVYIQICTSEVSTKKQSYCRKGGLHYVDVSTPMEDVTLSLLKRKVDLAPNLVNVELLATERGPPVMKIIQLGSLKDGMIINARERHHSVPVYHTVAIRQQVIPPMSTSKMSPSILAAMARKSKLASASPSLPVPNLKRKSTFPFPSPSILTSIPPSKLLNLGKTINESSSLGSGHVPIKLRRFSYDCMIWQAERITGIEIQEVAGQGGFRLAKDCLLDGKKMIVKEYLETSKFAIDCAEMTIEQHAKRGVQLHACAAYFAKKLAESLKLNGFAECFSYVDCQLGVIMGGPHKDLVVTIEPKLEGTFVKYINNDGCIEVTENKDYQQMAEALCHYSFQHSGQQFMLVDIQGVGLSLTDAEVSSMKQNDGGEMLFSIGNHHKQGLRTFFLKHVCNVFCQAADLKKVDVTMFFD